MSRLIELENAARNKLKTQTRWLKKNSLAAYLSSGLSECSGLSLKEAILVCIEQDSVGPGKEEAFEAVADGIKESTYISDVKFQELISLAQSETRDVSKYIGVSALEALAEKAKNASVEVLTTFVQLALEQDDEKGIAKVLYRSLRRCSHKTYDLEKKLEEHLKKFFIEEYSSEIEEYSSEQFNSEQFNADQYCGVSYEIFTKDNFKQLRELKGITQKVLAELISQQYKSCAERTVQHWEAGDYPIPQYAIRALLES